MNPADLLTITAIEGGLAVAGEIDGHTSPLLAEALTAVAAEQVLLDMAGVEFVDSSGLRVLIEAHQQAEHAGGSVTLTHPSAIVTRLLEISGVDSYLNVDRS
jgi:anti-sigma B factor antagonist